MEKCCYITLQYSFWFKAIKKTNAFLNTLVVLIEIYRLTASNFIHLRSFSDIGFWKLFPLVILKDAAQFIRNRNGGLGMVIVGHHYRLDPGVIHAFILAGDDGADDKTLVADAVHAG